MKKSRIILCVVCLLMIFSLTGCGSKKAITTDDFKSIAESSSYSIADVTSQYAEFNFINEATVAQSSDGWQVEFYMLEDKENATNMFNTNKSDFESKKDGFVTESSVNMPNYSTYSLTSGGYYMYLCRVDNTLLYVKVLDTYKDDVKALIKKLGY